MTVLEKWNSLETKIKDEGFKRIISGLVADHEKFLSKKKTGVRTFQGIIWALKDVYPEEIETITSLLTQKTEKKQIKTPMKAVNVSPKTEPQKEGGCTDCDKQEETAPKLTDAKSDEDVKTYFGGDIEKLRNYAKSQGIKISGVRSADGFAKKIFEWLSGDTE